MSTCRYAQTCLDLCGIESGDVGIRQFHLQDLLRGIASSRPTSPIHLSATTTTSFPVGNVVETSSPVVESTSVFLSHPLANSEVVTSMQRVANLDVVDCDKKNSTSVSSLDPIATDSSMSLNRSPSVYSTTSTCSSAVSSEAGYCDVFPAPGVSEATVSPAHVVVNSKMAAGKRRSRLILNASDSFTAHLPYRRQRVLVAVSSGSQNSIIPDTPKPGSTNSGISVSSFGSSSVSSHLASRNNSATNANDANELDDGFSNVIKIAGKMSEIDESPEQLVEVHIVSKAPSQVTMKRLRISLIELREYKRQVSLRLYNSQQIYSRVSHYIII